MLDEFVGTNAVHPHDSVVHALVTECKDAIIELQIVRHALVAEQMNEEKERIDNCSDACMEVLERLQELDKAAMRHYYAIHTH